MTADAASILWLDDEWGTAREVSLAPWRRALQTEQERHRVRLRTCSQLHDFARSLREGVESPGTAGEPSHRLLIIDLMLSYERDMNYASLGFDDERVVKLDAGVQIAGLIRSSQFDGQRPDWLAPYGRVPMLLLSSSPLLAQLVQAHVGYRRMQALRWVSKSLQQRPGGAGVDASADFLEAVRGLLSTGAAEGPSA